MRESLWTLVNRKGSQWACERRSAAISPSGTSWFLTTGCRDLAAPVPDSSPVSAAPGLGWS